MAVQLHQPEAHGRGVSVEHDRRLRDDTTPTEERLDRGVADEVIVGGLEVSIYVPKLSAVDVSLVVRDRAHIDFDDPYRGIAHVGFEPRRLDECLFLRLACGLVIVTFAVVISYLR